MASFKSIITPVEKNPDGSIKQKAIITGAIPKQPKSALSRLAQVTANRPVTFVTTPRKKSNTTPLRVQHQAGKQQSGLTPVKLRQAKGIVREKGCLQRAGIFPVRPKKVTIVENGNNKSADSTFEVPKNSATNLSHNSASQMKKLPSNQHSGALPKTTATQRTVACKSHAPKMQISYATNRRRRSSVLATSLGTTPSERKKMRSRIPVPVNPTVMPHHIQPEETTVFLMKKERELVEEVTSIEKQLDTKQKELLAVRGKLKSRLAAKFEESALRSVGATALPQTYESPAAAYNLRPPASSSATEKKDDVLKLQIEMDLSPLLGTPSPHSSNIPPDILLSISKSKTPSSIFENYRRNCAALRSPSTVIRRRSRSLSLHRKVLDINENSISERVMLQLRHLYD